MARYVARLFRSLDSDLSSFGRIFVGSCLHAVEALEKPRWEDYNYELLDKGVKNRFFYLGDGLTKNEKIRGGDSGYSSCSLAIIY